MSRIDTYPLSSLRETADNHDWYHPGRYVVPFSSSPNHLLAFDLSGNAAALAISKGCLSTHFGDVSYVSRCFRLSHRLIESAIDQAWMEMVHG